MRVIIVRLVIIFLIPFLNSCGGSSLENSGSVEDAKRTVDNYILKWDETYQSLCNKSRNDNLKRQFQNLSGSISSISGFGEACTKLSYSEQSEVSNYAINELKKRSHLMDLYNFNKISCW